MGKPVKPSELKETQDRADQRVREFFEGVKIKHCTAEEILDQLDGSEEEGPEVLIGNIRDKLTN